jgi:hypothetical protein
MIPRGRCSASIVWHTRMWCWSSGLPPVALLEIGGLVLRLSGTWLEFLAFLHGTSPGRPPINQLSFTMVVASSNASILYVVWGCFQILKTREIPPLLAPRARTASRRSLRHNSRGGGTRPRASSRSRNRRASKPTTTARLRVSTPPPQRSPPIKATSTVCWRWKTSRGLPLRSTAS